MLFFICYCYLQITYTVTSPEIAFTGDTTSDFLVDPENTDALKARILVMEVPDVSIMYTLVDGFSSVVVYNFELWHLPMKVED